MNYNLVPPKSKLVEYKSVILSADSPIRFMLKVFDFEEDDNFSVLALEHARKNDDGTLFEDDNGDLEILNDAYYVDMFKMGCPEIKGLKVNEGEEKAKFTPPWKVIKEVVNRVRRINTFIDLEK